MALQPHQVAHLLRRAGFGSTPEEIDYFTGREIDDVVDEIVDLRADPPPRPGFVYASVNEQWPAYVQSVGWWANRMVDASWVNRTSATPSPLQEKVALFWHGHFATEQQKVEKMEAMMEQNELFRNIGLDDFEPLCQAVSIGGAMLRYLDNDTNKVGAAQENFARELMELFTMGIGHYSERDVAEMARAWTGHGVVGWDPVAFGHDTTYVFRPEWHDNGDKTIFGLPPQNWDGPAALTEILQNSRRMATSRFITRKAWLYFGNPNPSTQLVNQLASVYRGNGPNGGNLNFAELLRAIFKHPVFWNSTSYRQLVKSPAHYVIDVCRRIGATPSDFSLEWYMGFMGQTLFNPPNVAGWKTNGYWLSTATAWGRSRFISNIRWQFIGENGTLFSDLSSLSPPAAAMAITDFFGIENPSAVSLAAIEDWFAAMNSSGTEWALPASALQIGALLPEFQLA